nr:unnamed protein product [Spirometra erinaceieuropaei]
MARIVSRFAPWFSRPRFFSAVAFHAPPNSVYSRVRNFIINNPSLRDTSATPLSQEPSKKLSKIQQELLEDLEASDERPNLIPFDEERRILGCICHEDNHHVSYLLLYKGIPTRCGCGHWFKLVDFNEYEAARERYWNSVKNEPENAKLLKDLEEAEQELQHLLEESKTMTKKSAGATEMMDKLLTQWTKYKTAYGEIRRIIDMACVSDIR